MGACCSCDKDQKSESYFGEDKEEENNKFEDDDDEEEPEVMLKGDYGASIRLNGSSKFVSMFTQQGKKLNVNQDAMTVWENFCGEQHMFFCAVFDGHGPSGHKVAQYARDLLPSKLSTSSQVSNFDGDEKGDNEGYKSPFFSSWKPRILESFRVMDDQLEGDAQIESYTSGTTSVALLKKGEHLVVANLGDSRAVVCTRDDEDQLVGEQLTVDLKPNVPGEAERIKSCQGRVKPMDEQPNVYRIWLPDEDCPGLAMSRAFGDFCLKDFGVVSTPQLFYRKLTDKDEFIVLATDGVWDALSNDEVVGTVASAKQRSIAAKMLVERAVATWQYKFPLAKVDDCAAICLFFKKQSPELTKSLPQKTQLSLNYTHGAKGHERRSTNDDGLDTVLNYNLEDSADAAAPGRVRKRRRFANRFRSAVS